MTFKAKIYKICKKVLAAFLRENVFILIKKAKNTKLFDGKEAPSTA
jgi:hypothetical protein